MKPLRFNRFNETGLFKKLGKVAKTAGLMVAYPAVLLFYLFKDKNVPLRSKSMIAAALAYFIFPADTIPDITPIIGYSDDVSIMLVSISQLVKYITPEILEKTRKRLVEWFGETHEIERHEEKILKQISEKND